MNFKQKLGYMCIGCLFTIAGYMLASLGGGATHAQNSEQVINEIVCRKLKVVDALGRTVVNTDQLGMTFYDIHGKRIASIDPLFRNMYFYNAEGKKAVRIWTDEDGGEIGVFNAAGELVALIAATENGGGMSVNNAAGKVDIGILATENGGALLVNNAAGKVVAGITTDENGGKIGVLNAAGKDVAGIAATEDGDGIIQTYKGGWRTH